MMNGEISCFVELLRRFDLLYSIEECITEQRRPIFSSAKIVV